MEYLPNIIGLTGAGMALVAYFLLSAGKLSSEHIAYPLLNMFGSMGILISLYWQFNLPSAVINTIWVGISVLGLWRVLRKRKA